jgi:hypothetical protein
MSTHFEARREFEQALAEARAATDDEQAGDLVLAAGWNGLAVLQELVDDDGLWKRAAQDPRPLGEKDLARVWAALEGGWAALLDDVGYVPPPEAQELADQFLGGLTRLLADPAELDHWDQDVLALRADVAQFAAELHAILLAARRIPRRLQARSVQGPLTRLIGLVRATAPFAVAEGLAGQIPGLGPLAVAVAKPVLERIGADQRRRTAAERRALADRAMRRLEHELSWERLEPVDRESALSRAWAADAALRLVLADEVSDAASEALVLVRVLRDQVAEGARPDQVLVGKLAFWRDLDAGWTHASTRERQEALKRRAAQAPRVASMEERGPTIGALPTEEAAEEPEEEALHLDI